MCTEWKQRNGMYANLSIQSVCSLFVVLHLCLCVWRAIIVCLGETAGVGSMDIQNLLHINTVRQSGLSTRLT